MSADLHALSDAASAAFAALVPCANPHCHGGRYESGFDCETCGGSGRVMPRDLDTVLAEVTAKLARSSIYGAFYREQTAVRLLVRWSFEASRHEERRALHEVERALWAAGHGATAFPELHHVTVRTDETRPVGDTACVHNVEPRPEVVAECRAEEAALAAE